MNLLAVYNSIPATVREPIRSFIISCSYNIWGCAVTMVVIGYTSPQVHCCTTFVSTLEYLRDGWWALMLGIVFGIGPYVRAKQANTKAKEG